MKARVTIWTLAWDAGAGTECEVFGTERDFHEFFGDSIRTAISEVDGSNADRVRELLLQEKFEEALDLWSTKLRAPLDTYVWDTHTVEVELSEELATHH